MSEVLEYRESDESVLVPWSLPDLPTAQHKAGLAGLFVYVSKMPEFIQNAPFPVIESVSPLELSIRFTQASLTTLMDSVYAGEKYRVKVKKKWQRGTLVEEKTEAVEVNGQQRQVKFFVYEVDRPRAELISHWRSGNGEDSWVVLWRSAVREVLRKDRAGKFMLSQRRGKARPKNPAISKNCGAGLSQPLGNAGERPSLCRPPCSSARSKRATSAWISRAKYATISSCISGRLCLRFSFPRPSSVKTSNGNSKIVTVVLSWQSRK